MRTLTWSRLKGLECLPRIGQGIRVVNLLHAIRRLEMERRWDRSQGGVFKRHAPVGHSDRRVAFLDLR